MFLTVEPSNVFETSNFISTLSMADNISMRLGQLGYSLKSKENDLTITCSYWVWYLKLIQLFKQQKTRLSIILVFWVLLDRSCKSSLPNEIVHMHFEIWAEWSQILQTARNQMSAPLIGKGYSAFAYQ